jgi:hypothetical protein
MARYYAPERRDVPMHRAYLKNEYRGVRDGESTTGKPTLDESSAERLVSRFDQLSVWARAVIWGWIVFVASFALDLILFRLLFGITRPLAEAILFANFTSAVLIGVIVFSVLHTREELFNRRQREIGYLNHHVRNALMVIENAEHLDRQQQRQSMVLEETARIRKCIEQISRNADVEISDENPRAA